MGRNRFDLTEDAREAVSVWLQQLQILVDHKHSSVAVTRFYAEGLNEQLPGFLILPRNNRSVVLFIVASVEHPSQVDINLDFNYYDSIFSDEDIGFALRMIDDLLENACARVSWSDGQIDYMLTRKYVQKKPHRISKQHKVFFTPGYYE